MSLANNISISRLRCTLTQSLICFQLAVIHWQFSTGSFPLAVFHWQFFIGSFPLQFQVWGAFLERFDLWGSIKKCDSDWEFLLLVIANWSRQPRETGRFAQSPKSKFVLFQQWLKDVH